MKHSDKQRELAGVVPIIPVPFDRNDAIDYGALRSVVDFAAELGVSGICVPAYGGEFYKLSDEERIRVVEWTVKFAAGRLLVVAQSNHGSARVARALARANRDAGADLVGVAIPRQFPLSDDVLLEFLTAVLNEVDCPCVVQDFNPGGPLLGVEFVLRLRAECGNFAHLKLEAPMMACNVRSIREATNDEVGVLEGWGGLYMMELIPAGIRGVMPGLAIADILQRVFDLRVAGQTDEAFRLYGQVLPQITCALQNMELFLYCEKRLLQARGVLADAQCRSPRLVPDPEMAEYIDELNVQILKLLKGAGMWTKVARQNWRQHTPISSEP